MLCTCKTNADQRVMHRLRKSLVTINYIKRSASENAIPLLFIQYACAIYESGDRTLSKDVIFRSTDWMTKV